MEKRNAAIEFIEEQGREIETLRKRVVELQERVITAFDNGYKEGYNAGYDDCNEYEYQKGYEKGYDDGYNDGWLGR